MTRFTANTSTLALAGPVAVHVDVLLPHTVSQTTSGQTRPKQMTSARALRASDFMTDSSFELSPLQEVDIIMNMHARNVKLLVAYGLIRQTALWMKRD